MMDEAFGSEVLVDADNIYLAHSETCDYLERNKSAWVSFLTKQNFNLIWTEESVSKK